MKDIAVKGCTTDIPILVVVLAAILPTFIGTCTGAGLAVAVTYCEKGVVASITADDGVADAAGTFTPF